MAQTSFTGPVASANGFINGTATSPVSVTTAQNINSSYATTSATTGDTRLVYDKLTFTSTGSGETLRAFSVVTGAGAAAAGRHTDRAGRARRLGARGWRLHRRGVGGHAA